MTVTVVTYVRQPRTHGPLSRHPALELVHLDTTARRTAQGQELLSVARTELGFLRDRDAKSVRRRDLSKVPGGARREHRQGRQGQGRIRRDGHEDQEVARKALLPEHPKASVMYCRRGALHCSVSGGRRPDCVWGQVHQIRSFDCMLASHTAVDVVWCLRTHTAVRGRQRFHPRPL